MGYARMTRSRPTTLALALGLVSASLLHAQAPVGQAVVRGSVVTLEDRPIAQAVVELRVRGTRLRSVPPGAATPVGSSSTTSRRASTTC